MVLKFVLSEIFTLSSLRLGSFLQEEAASPVGSDKIADEEGEDLDDDDEEYDEEEDEEDDDRPRKKPKHGGFILDEAGARRRLFFLCGSVVGGWAEL